MENTNISVILWIHFVEKNKNKIKSTENFQMNIRQIGYFIINYSVTDVFRMSTLMSLKTVKIFSK